MARPPEAAAAWKTPVPEPPATWNTMSVPAEYMPCARICARAGSLNPVKSPAGERYSELIWMSGLTARAPASYPAWNVWMSCTSWPPMKPI